LATLVLSKVPPTLCRPRGRRIWQPVRQHRTPDVAPPRSQGRLPRTSPALSRRTTQASSAPAPAPAWGDAPCEQIKKLSLKHFSFEVSVCSGVSPQTTGLSTCKPLRRCEKKGTQAEEASGRVLRLLGRNSPCAKLVHGGKPQTKRCVSLCLSRPRVSRR